MTTDSRDLTAAYERPEAAHQTLSPVGGRLSADARQQSSATAASQERYPGITLPAPATTERADAPGLESRQAAEQRYGPISRPGAADVPRSVRDAYEQATPEEDPRHA